MTNENKIVLFETEDKKVLIPVEVKDETVWLNQIKWRSCLVEI